LANDIGEVIDDGIEQLDRRGEQCAGGNLMADIVD
jgi:hypothetical protein